VRIATIVGPLSIGTEISADRLVPASRLYQARPGFWNDRTPRNIGDWFINMATVRLLDFEEMYHLRPDAPPESLDFVNQHCDAVVLKGGNYLQRRGALSTFLSKELLDAFRIPVILIGAGTQAGPGQRGELAPEDIDILKQIHDSCASSSVRGYSSAELLAEHGIHNVSVTGCPTLFWQRGRELHLQPPRRDHAVFTYRDGLFTNDPALYRNQFVALEAIRRQSSRVTVALQGEELALQDLFMAERWGTEYGERIVTTDLPGLSRVERVRLDSDALRAGAIRRYSSHTDAATAEWLTRSTFFSWDVLDYLDLFRGADLAVGCRLHGNLMALSNGTPAYFLTYDRRIEEIAELLNAPRASLLDLPEDFDPFLADWAPVEAAYRDLRNRMITFLERNGLRHRLGTFDHTV